MLFSTLDPILSGKMLAVKGVIIVAEVTATILAVIFWDFLMFYQIFLSLQVKRIVRIRNKHGICKLPNDIRL